MHEDHIDSTLKGIEEDLVEEERISGRTVNEKDEHPLGDVMQLHEEAERKAKREGFTERRVGAVSPPLSTEQKQELAQQFMEMGMPEDAARYAARGHAPDAERQAWFARMGMDPADWADRPFGHNEPWRWLFTHDDD